MKTETQILPLALCVLCAGTLLAQQPIAPTPETVGNPDGENWRNYNFTSFFETGYRFNQIAGDGEAYRSMVNFGDGVRLLNSSVTARSREGRGFLFDDLSLTTLGLGGDPYESAALRLGKNRVYRYEMMWRQNDYVNPGLTGGGAPALHALNTTYSLQDHDLTILPESHVRFFLGYSRARNTGPGLSTVSAFDPSTFVPVFSEVRWTQNEYRLGNEIRLHGFILNWLHGWQDFQDDTEHSAPAAPGGPVTAFERTGPNHGTSPYWRVSLLRNRNWLGLNGRFTYTAGRRAYIVDESALGSPAAAGAPRRILSTGDAQRPVTTGNFTISVQPGDKITIANQTSFYNVRTEGNNAYFELDANRATNFLYFEYLGIRTVANATNLTYRFNRYLSAHAGYEFSQRRIRSIRQVAPGNSAPFDQENTEHIGLAGLAFSGLGGLSASVHAEIGRADRPFTPKGDGADHLIAGEVRYRWRTLQAGASTRVDYNNNAVTLTAFRSHARTYSATGSWSPMGWLTLDAAYSKLHLETLGGIAYFAAGAPVAGEQSYYVSDIHSGTGGARVSLKNRVDLFGGYTIVRDVGDGRASALATSAGSSAPVFEAAQTFPLRFQSPVGRVSVRVIDRVRLNFGYQRYGYGEQFFADREFRANTGYVSLLWSF